MGSKKAGTIKAGPSQKRYTAESRWNKNKARSTARGEREREAAKAKHKRRGTLGYRARQVERSQTYGLRVLEKQIAASEKADVREA